MLLLAGGGLAAVVAWTPGWGVVLGGLLGVLVVAALFTIAIGLEMATAARWEYASADGSLRGQVERFGGLRGGVGVVLATESVVAAAPRDTSSTAALQGGLDEVMTALAARGHLLQATSDRTVREVVALVLSALTGLSARGEVDVTIEREVTWRKGYGRRARAGEPRSRVALTRTGVEMPVGVVEMLMHGVLIGKDAMHQVAGPALPTPYRQVPNRSGMRMSVVAMLGEIAAERLKADGPGTSPERATEVADAIDAWLRAAPEAGAVLWGDVVELARDRFES